MSRNRISLIRQRLGKVWTSITGTKSHNRGQLINQGQNQDDEVEIQLREEEDFQLALALSESEAVVADKIPKDITGLPCSSKSNAKLPPSIAAITYEMEGNGNDSDLSQYMSKTYWNDSREYWTVGGAVPSAPSPSDVSLFSTRECPSVYKPKNNETIVTVAEISSSDASNDEVKTLNLVSELTKQVEAMILRIQSNLSRGRSVDSDFGLYAMFKNVSAKHTDVLTCLDEWEAKRAFYERLQDNIANIRLLREALDTMRLENSLQMHRQSDEEKRVWKQQLEAKNTIVSDCKILPKVTNKEIDELDVFGLGPSTSGNFLNADPAPADSAIPADLLASLEALWSMQG